MRHIKKGNLVIVRSGKDKGKTGRVLEILPDKNSALVEGVNLAAKHRRRRKQEEPVGIVKVELPLNLSKILSYCPKCKKGVKVKIDKSEKKEKKFCKECQTAL